MTCSQGSNTRLAYVAESVYGTTPTTPTLINLPYRTHSLDLQKAYIESNDIQGDRIPRNSRHGTKSGVGSIEVDLRRGSYDALLESALMGAWTSNVLKVGSTSKFFTFEDQATDITQFRAFKGLTVNSLNVSIAPDQMVQATFNMLGRDMTQGTTSVSASAPTADAGYEPFDSFGAILEGGSAIGVVTSLEFTVDNSRANVPVIGSQLSACVDYGNAVVTGTMTVRYQNKTLIDKFLNETASSISVTVSDALGTSSLQFVFPSVKYNGAAVPVANPQGRVLTLPFVAEHNESEGTNLKIIRNYAA
jgi:hypothetical protein